jgi:hypothetical protein
MPLQQTSGNNTYDAYGGGAAYVPAYIEDVFSTYLYTGNGTTGVTINNGIDLSGKGGLVWTKARITAGYNHELFDTVRTSQYYLETNTTNAQTNYGSTDYFTFNSNGFIDKQAPTESMASWTFRKQPKFFDVVTYTGNGVLKTITHNLGSAPGFIVTKNTSASYSWCNYHISLGNDKVTYFGTQAAYPDVNAFNSYTPTATDFQVGGSSATNAGGGVYVAYLFAHNAGGFGLTGADNVISCGSFNTGSGSPSITLGYEPQWLLFKKTSDTSNWYILDNMRGWSQVGAQGLFANTSGAESAVGNSSVGCRITSTGVSFVNFFNPSETWIYIAIRRGPMKVPTVGTSVFKPIAQTNVVSRPYPVTVGFPVDSAWFGQRNGWGVNFITSDRLRGATALLLTTSTNAESTNNSTYGPSTSRLDSNTQFFDGMTNASEPDIYWNFQRAPGFFDEVCYTGTGAGTQTYNHNLGVTPEMMIVKCRSDDGTYWFVYQNSLGLFGGGYPNFLLLNGTTPKSNGASSVWGAVPTSTQFTVGAIGDLGMAGRTYVNYLFATCPGVSKVGSYTGTGATQTIDCGFTGGARFVLIKRTDSTGDWYVWDTARGMVSGTDPSLLLNTTAAEVNANSVYTTGVGFQIVSTAAGINASGGTYIFWAVA